LRRTAGTATGGGEAEECQEMSPAGHGESFRLWVCGRLCA
jgi:hypothetical protein